MKIKKKKLKINKTFIKIITKIKKRIKNKNNSPLLIAKFYNRLVLLK